MQGCMRITTTITVTQKYGGRHTTQNEIQVSFSLLLRDSKGRWHWANALHVAAARLRGVAGSLHSGTRLMQRHTGRGGRRNS